MATSTVTILKRTYTEWSSHNAMRLAAAMAFYTMMLLAPLLVVALTVLSLYYKNDAQQKIATQAEKLVGHNGAEAIQQMLTATSQHHSGGLRATVISFVIALISASGLFISLQDAINTIWDVKPKPSAGWKAMIRPRLVSIGILFGAGIILAGSIAFSFALSVIVKSLPGWLSWVSFIGDILVSYCVITLLFGMIFKFLPDVKLVWRDVVLGAAITGALFLLGKYGITLYFRFASTQPFGAAGSLAALLIFVYYSATLIFFGAEFTRVYAEETGTPIKPDVYAVKLTTNDRAKRGEPHPDELEHAEAEEAGEIPSTTPRRPSPARRSAPSNPTPAPARYAAAGAGLALGAIVGAVGALTYRAPERRMRTRAAQLRLHDRLQDAERHMHRAAKVHDLLERMSVSERVDAVEDRLRKVMTEVDKRPAARPLASRLRSWLS